MPSAEMLRKLLDEFVEKETLIQEELKIIQEQLQQLDMRLSDCRQRLSTVGTDREKVLSIRARYIGTIANIISTTDLSVAGGRLSTAANKITASQGLATNQPAMPDRTNQAWPSVPQTALPSAQAAPPTTGGINAILGARHSAVPYASALPRPAAPANDSPGNTIGGAPSDLLSNKDAAYAAPADSPGPANLNNNATAASASDNNPVEPESSIVDLGGSEDQDNSGSDNETVKSINDALRSLFRGQIYKVTAGFTFGLLRF